MAVGICMTVALWNDLDGIVWCDIALADNMVEKLLVSVA